MMVPIEPWQNSNPFFGAVAFCMTKIDNLKTICPCRSHIKRLHYPAFAVFFRMKIVTPPLNKKLIAKFYNFAHDVPKSVCVSVIGMMGIL